MSELYQASPCPPPDRLRAYSNGQVPPRECELISHHLSACQRCVQELERGELAVDELVSGLRHAPLVDDWSHEQECDQMLARLRVVESHTLLEDTSQPSGLTSQAATPLPDSDRHPTAQKRRPPETLPREFGRYRLLKALGDGGMGAVYQAYDTQLDREVALKIPHFGSQANSIARDRFLREARAAANIVHPHVCQIFDVGEVDGVPFLTMRLIHGESLAARLKRDPQIPLETSIPLIHKLALALDVVHQRGIVHRDIKPGNILLDEIGEPLLTDFGLAQRVSPGESELTQAGEVLGTPAYMSPEQARGSHMTVGAASDIYSLGVVLYELLTGQRPFRGSATEVLAAVIQSPPRPPIELRPELPPQLSDICLKCLSKQVVDRYSSMADLAADLAKFLSPAASGNAGERGTGKWLLAAAAGVGLLLAGIVILFSGNRGTVEVRLNDKDVTVQIFRPDQPPLTIDGNSASPLVRLPPGAYRAEIAGTVDQVRLTPDHFELERNGKVILEVIELPAPAAPEVPAVAQLPAVTVHTPAVPEAAAPFAIATHGLIQEATLVPGGPLPDWQHPKAFAELRTAGKLDYPSLPATRYVLETELEFRQPGNALFYRLLDERYRIWLRMEWDEMRGGYRVRLQRQHGRGSWFINWRVYRVGKRLNLRLVMWDGMAVLFEGDQQILTIASVAVTHHLQIEYEQPVEGTAIIHRCLVRPVTPIEEAAARTAWDVEQKKLQAEEEKKKEESRTP